MRMDAGNVKVSARDLFKSPREMRELTLLQELEKDPVISQRELSHRFGMALGVTNSCLRNMALKGWIRVRDASHHRTGYFITPKGADEKNRLFLKMVAYNVRHYSHLKSLMADLLDTLQRENIRRLVFYGVSEEMEVAFVTLNESGVDLVGIVEDEDKRPPKKLLGHEVGKVTDVLDFNPDAILVTSFADAERRVTQLQEILAGQNIKIFRL
jgi:DNA-binding PadR family transcriptional regulator